MSDTNHGVAIEVSEIETDELLEQVDDEIQREEGVIAEVNAEEKAKKIEREKHRLMVNLAEGNMKHLITKIAYLLNKYPSTRNSDITLQLKYWREFERFNIEEKPNGGKPHANLQQTNPKQNPTNNKKQRKNTNNKNPKQR
ncbi:hypothetical protein P4261_05435 [Bacillus thuringiensis]|nr:hypothetical protein [Bacillus thuringiensis]MED2810480.1 hypothetical protein [Bacillus thuringiensis]MED2824863.1 hypothetical protein [Bacillus thuringiensis]MED2833636.1 hypothetical protein [Bacillus thuringiensis]MED2849080.1 hypothetical protein [Bacillus thuringiensis]